MTLKEIEKIVEAKVAEAKAQSTDTNSPHAYALGTLQSWAAFVIWKVSHDRNYLETLKEPTT